VSESRPTPSYGERAPEGWVWSPPGDGADSESVDQAEPVKPAGLAEPVRQGSTDVPDAPPRPYLLADAATSVFLLVLGLAFEASAIPGLFQLRGTVEKFYTDRDLGEYGGGSAVDIVGTVAGSAHIVLLLLAIALTVRVIGQRRRSWPVPLLLGALAGIVTFVSVALALVADPGFISSISSS
jgi:hypothetical protein